MIPARSERIVVIDDDPSVLESARLVLKRRFATVLTAGNPAKIAELMQECETDVVLLDMNFRRGDDHGEDGLAWIDKLLADDPSLSVVCITAYGDIDLAVESMRRGAADFVVKPWDNERLVATVRSAVELSRSRRQAGVSQDRVRALTTGPLPNRIIARSRAFRETLEIAQRVAPSDASVLILGENGVGKEVVAREIHRLSLRAAEPFVAIDLGAIPEHLVESELFGHRKGAFTDARSDRAGRIAAAEGGTLFLDEIGNAPPALQQKLLTLLERREMTPVGSDRAMPINVRVVAATNASREHLSDPHRFRPDLYFRLNTIELTVPPLRARRDDIEPLVEQFAEEFARRYGKQVRRPDEETAALLLAYDWPGNVRALRHAIERATILATGSCFAASDFALGPVRQQSATSASEPATLEQLERQAIVAALQRHSGNTTRAASDLGVTRQALYRRMSRYGL